MPRNTLRQLIERADRRNARPNRLTGELMLPPRPDSLPRRVCGSCWQVADTAAWQAAVQRWRDDRRVSDCEFYDDSTPECQGHWQEESNTWIVHRYKRARDKCPRCGGALHGVQP